MRVLTVERCRVLFSELTQRAQWFLVNFPWQFWILDVAIWFPHDVFDEASPFGCFLLKHLPSNEFRSHFSSDNFYAVPTAEYVFRVSIRKVFCS